MGPEYGCFLLAAAILAYLITSTFVREWRRARELRKLAKCLRLNYGGQDRLGARVAGLSPFLLSGASQSYDVFLGNHQGHAI